MAATLAATYPCLADALRTRQELQELRIPSADISVAMRRGSPAVGDPDQPERAVSGLPSRTGEIDIAQALRRAGIHELVASHLASDVDHGCVLVATVIDAPAHRESAELIMARRARFPDLVGEARDERGERHAAPAPRAVHLADNSPRA